MGDDSGVEFVFLWPLFAVFHQAVLPEEFSGLKSVKLLALRHSGPVRIGPANEPGYVRLPAFANAEAVVEIELAVDDRPRIRIDLRCGAIRHAVINDAPLQRGGGCEGGGGGGG